MQYAVVNAIMDQLYSLGLDANKSTAYVVFRHCGSFISYAMPAVRAVQYWKVANLLLRMRASATWDDVYGLFVKSVADPYDVDLASQLLVRAGIEPNPGPPKSNGKTTHKEASAKESARKTGAKVNAVGVKAKKYWQKKEAQKSRPAPPQHRTNYSKVRLGTEDPKVAYTKVEERLLPQPKTTIVAQEERERQTERDFFVEDIIQEMDDAEEAIEQAAFGASPERRDELIVEMEALGKHDDDPFSASQDDGENQSATSEVDQDPVVIELDSGVNTYYNFEPEFKDGNVTSEQLLESRTSGERKTLWPLVGVLALTLFSTFTLLVDYPGHVYVTYLKYLWGFYEMFKLFKYYFWGRLEYRRFISVASAGVTTPNHRRVLQDSVREPTHDVHSVVEVQLTVKIVVWNGRSWTQNLNALERFRVKYFWPKLFGTVLKIPLDLWAAVLAAANRVAVREEQLVAMSVDNAIRGYRSQLSLDMRDEVQGLTGDVAVCAVHMYRAHRYRNSKNLLLAKA